MGIIITIINNKGGVGKTSLSCNLGAALSRMHKKVLVIDNDPQSNATTNLLKDIKIKNSLYELLEPDNDIKVEDCIYLSQEKNLFCLPNIRDTSGLEMDFVELYPKSLNILKNKVQTYVQNNYDYTIIDTPPNIGMFTTKALITCQYVIVPIDSSSADSLDGLKEAIKLVETVKERFNKNINQLKLIINRVHGHKIICKAIIENIKSQFNENQVFKTMIPETTAMQQAVFLRETIFKNNRTCKAAKAFRELAKEIIEGGENGS